MLLYFVVYVCLLLYETYFFLFSYYYFNIYSFRILNDCLYWTIMRQNSTWRIYICSTENCLWCWMGGLLVWRIYICSTENCLWCWMGGLLVCVQMPRCLNDLCCTWDGNPYMQPILCMVVNTKTTIFACIIPCGRMLRHLSYFGQTFIFKCFVCCV